METTKQSGMNRLCVKPLTLRSFQGFNKQQRISQLVPYSDAKRLRSGPNLDLVVLRPIFHPGELQLHRSYTFPGFGPNTRTGTEEFLGELYSAALFFYDL